jgi:septum formation protein
MAHDSHLADAPPPQLILASGSPQRRALLAEAGYRFEIVEPDDSAEACGICTTGGPAALVCELALRKAANVVGKLTASAERAAPPRLVIACDTLAECAGSVLGKPQDEEHARDMLLRLRGQAQRVLSGVCLWPLGMPDRAPQNHLAVTELRMDPISDDALEAYLESGLWRGKAGGFGYQDRKGWLHVLEGSESNVVGLPMEWLEEQLAGYGIVVGSC